MRVRAREAKGTSEITHNGAFIFARKETVFLGAPIIIIQFRHGLRVRRSFLKALLRNEAILGAHIIMIQFPYSLTFISD